jgi:acyl-CoA thioester hydrolase
MAKEDFSLIYPLRVRWAEVDIQGIVFNANYLMYLDVGVTEYWRAMTGGNPAAVKDFIENLYVVRSTLDFHGSAKYDDMLDVCARAQKLGNSSMGFLFEIYRGDELLITGHITYVYALDGKSKPIPSEFRSLFLGFEKIKPE